NNQYVCLDERLRKVHAGDPQTYDALVKQRQELEENLREGSKKREILSQYQTNAEECLNKLYEYRVELTKRREAFLNDTIADNSYVRIKVIPFGDKSTIENDLRNLIGCDAGFDYDIGVAEGNEGLLAMLNQSSQSMDENIAKLKSTLLAIHANDPTAMDEIKDRRFASRVQRLNPEQIDRIHCWFPEDSLDVRYRFNDGEGFKPLGQGSPGQKTAALLAFILSYGSEPLVLDQPEDDLDNQLIYDLIVTQLREVKQKRQVLIVTHNANIVVNGDAENIIVLDVKAGQTKIVAQGSLQEPSIRREICRVMEGGKDAFDRRYTRINAGL
ncbi:MAG: AAA family ATPase, partial [Desulfovibrionaceae bacterium]|nr:AAA family ATPase [Desulfovibrionaceae bacterium]